MPDLCIDQDVTDDTGKILLSRETVQQEMDRWTAEHPPIPGLRWVISWGITPEDGTPHVRDRHLEVIPGWEDAFAPSVAAKPATQRTRDALTSPAEAERLGALAYRGWHSALPERVRNVGVAWQDTPELFREPLRQAAVLVWQHAENAGFHEALLRTLPAGQLGAAGALENLGDFIAALTRLHGGRLDPQVLLVEIRDRIQQLRRDAQAGTRRVREQDNRP